MNVLPESLKKAKNGADDIDYSYYNVNISNSDNIPIVAKFSENRVQPILENPSLYELTVARFSVPSNNIPLLFFKNDYYVKLIDQASGLSVQTPLVWIQNNTVNVYASTGRLPVYDFSEITESLNIAFKQCYTDLNVLTGGTLANIEPFMVYDPTTQLFTLNAETVGYDDKVANTVQIVFSSSLFYVYNNLQDFFLSPDETRIRVYDTFTNTAIVNGVTVLQMVQSQPTLELFSDIAKIELISNSIPVRPELVGGQLDVRKRLITDFNVTGVADKGVISFFPQGPLRYYDMLSTYPLREIDLEFRFQTKDGETYEIFIDKDDAATCKIMFKKKIKHRLNLE